MITQLVSLASVLLALAAVCISAWQVRSGVQIANKSNTLPVISAAFAEWRSPQFNDALHELLNSAPEKLTVENFEALEPGVRHAAFEVCYLFDHLGALVALRIVDEDVVVGLIGSQLMRVWEAMYPLILRERNYRIATYPDSAPPGFLVYYEHIISRIMELGGRDAARNVQQRAGIKRLDATVSSTPASR